MGYQGFDQVVCANLHLHSVDCYDFYNHEDWRCPDCGKPAVWWNQVNLTNPCNYDECELPKSEKDVCCNHGCGYIELKEKTPAEYKVCNLGFNHCIKPATYAVPKNRGHLIKKKEE